MKSSVILVFLALGVMVNGAWWVAAVNPLILSLGAILGAINSDVTETIELKNILRFVNKQSADEQKDKEPLKKDDAEKGSYGSKNHENS